MSRGKQVHVQTVDSMSMSVMVARIPTSTFYHNNKHELVAFQHLLETAESERSEIKKRSRGQVTMSILCIGPSGSGKTLLLKRLSSSSVDETTTTVETVGSNIVHVPHKAPPPAGDTSTGSGANTSSKAKSRNEKETGVREVGGSLAPLWPSYYNSTKLIIFVLDSSNLFQVSISTTMLMELISHEKLINTRFLIALTKKDLTRAKELNYLKFMMRLDNIVGQGGGSSGGRITLVEVSSISGEGIEAVRNWIVANSSKL